MNKIDFAKINKKEDMIMAFNQIKDDYAIAFQQITQLINNWNELEKWLKEENEYSDYKDVFYREHMGYVLDKMKEIKEKSNER